MSVVGAQTDTESGNGVVIHTEGDTVFVGDIKLQRRLMSLMDPTCIGEVVSIQTGKELCLITEVLIASPERDTCLVPGGGEDGVLTLGAVYRKEIQRLMMGVVETDRYDDVSGTDICPFGE